MSQDVTTETDSWQVAIAPNNIQTMTLEQLDSAYQQGVITEQTMVWTDGMDAWAPLSEVAGGDDEEDEQTAMNAQPPQAAAPAVAAAGAAPMFGHTAPMVGGVAGQAFAASQPPAGSAMGMPPQAHSFPPAGMPGAVGPHAGQVAQASNAPAPGVSFAPGAAPASMPPGQGVTMSTAPVAMNLDSLTPDDLDFGAKKGKSKVGLIAAAAVVLVGVGVTVMNLGGSDAEEAPAVAAQPVAPAEVPLATNDPNAPLQVQAAGYQVTKAEEKAFAKEEEAAKEAREMQAKMADALAGEKEKAGAKPAANNTKRTWKKPAKQKGGALQQGGSAYDPLNASLD